MIYIGTGLDFGFKLGWLWAGPGFKPIVLGFWVGLRVSGFRKSLGLDSVLEREPTTSSKVLRSGPG